MDWLDSTWEYLTTHAVELTVRFAIAAAIFVLALVLGSMLGRWATRALHRKSRRSATLASVVRAAIKTVVIGIGLLMALDHIGIDIKAFLAGAGVLGLAIGFGAQSLVKDVISGFFLILDDALGEGDIANVGGEATGVIEHVGLRVTRVRAFDGQLWYIQNGEIQKVGSFSRDWTRAVVSVGLAYEQDVAKGLRVLQEVGDAYAADNPDLVVEPPEAQGVMGFNSSDVGVRLVVKVVAPNHWAAERDLRKRVKEAFDAAGVEVPFPRHVVYHRQEEGETAPVLGTSDTP
jgi:moderate conductance mechanosensitive channel